MKVPFYIPGVAVFGVVWNLEWQMEAFLEGLFLGIWWIVGIWGWLKIEGIRQRNRRPPDAAS